MHANRRFRGTGKKFYSRVGSLPAAPLGRRYMDPWNGLFFSSVEVFHTYGYITLLLCSCRAKLKQLKQVWRTTKREQRVTETEEEVFGLLLMKKGEDIGTIVRDGVQGTRTM